MWRMLQQDKPNDYLIASGQTNSLKAFIKEVFSCLKLNWQDHVVHQQELIRPTDIDVSMADPCKAEKELGWKAQYVMSDVVRMIVEAELN
jgi:GDPmannose 4,6-dehydratase